MSQSSTRKKRGAPTKAPGGLPDVLFLRVSPDLIRRLDAVVERERAERPGRTVSRSDVAREMLYRATGKVGDGSQD